jgi:hypothetical protein
MNDPTCLHCGAEIQTAGDEYYLCWTNIKYPWDRDECCYERQIAAQAAEIERLKQAVLGEREACAEIAWAHVCTDECQSDIRGAACCIRIAEKINVRGEVK